MKILIGADLVPTNSNIEFFESGDSKALLGEELNNILQNADYRIFNLEVPLTDQKQPIPKLWSKPDCTDQVCCRVQSYAC